MRTLALTTLVASAGFSFAGQSPKQAIVPAAIIPQQSSGCPQCLNYSGLFLGAGVEYLFDAETEYYNGRVGYEWAAPSANYSQSLFLEVGWLETEEGFTSADAIPVTLNYEYKRALTRCLNFYIGGGVGVAFVDGDIDAPKTESAEPIDRSFDDTVLAVQAFAGLTYCITQSVELYGGVRYLWTDDIDGGDGLDDWSIGAGLRVKF
jgi:opacity protein-like surface antigen